MELRGALPHLLGRGDVGWGMEVGSRAHHMGREEGMAVILA